MSENLPGRFAVHSMARADDWETPADVFGPLNQEFGFTLDAAALPRNAKCADYFTPDSDGLRQAWGDRVVWLNPPYGRVIGKWMHKAWWESTRGATVVCLVPARTDTRWWHDIVIGGGAEVRFVRGRIRFLRGGEPIGDASKGSAKSPFPSAVVVFRPTAQREAA